MTNKEVWIWYKAYWEKKFPDFTKSEFVLDKQGEITGLKVLRPSWKAPTTKMFNDAKWAYDKFGPNAKPIEPVKNNVLKVSLKPAKAKKEAKVFKTVGCSIDQYKYDKVKAVAKANNMSVHELIKNLLDQIIEGK